MKLSSTELLAPIKAQDCVYRTAPYGLVYCEAGEMSALSLPIVWKWERSQDKDNILSPKVCGSTCNCFLKLFDSIGRFALIGLKVLNHLQIVKVLLECLLLLCQIGFISTHYPQDHHQTIVQCLQRPSKLPYEVWQPCTRDILLLWMLEMTSLQSAG